MTMLSETNLILLKAELGDGDGIHIVQTGEPTCWRLQNEGTGEEVVIVMHGIICDKKLPPLKVHQ